MDAADRSSPTPLWMTQCAKGVVLASMLDGLCLDLSSAEQAAAGPETVMWSRKLFDEAACYLVAEVISRSEEPQEPKRRRDRVLDWKWAAACLGHTEAMDQIALALAAEASASDARLDAPTLAGLAVDWMVRAQVARKAECGHGPSANRPQADEEAPTEGAGAKRPRGRLFTPLPTPAARDTTASPRRSFRDLLRRSEVQPGEADDVEIVEAERLADELDEAAETGGGPKRRLLDGIADDAPTAQRGTGFRQRFANLLKDLPLAGGVDWRIVRRRMDALYPWMTDVTDHVVKHMRLAEAEGAHWFRMPPLLLLGVPGCGKSDYLPTLAGILGLHIRVLPMAGMSDDKTITGTPRGWSTALPGIVPLVCNEAGIANPFLLFDELDKCGGNRNGNGNPHDALLPLLEPSTASRLYDPALCGAFDASHAVCAATANSLDGIPSPILDRFQTIRVRPPGPEHIESIIGSMRLRDAARLGIRPETLPPLHPMEMDFLRGVLRERRSLRPLRKAYDAIRARQAEEFPGFAPEYGPIH